MTRVSTIVAIAAIALAASGASTAHAWQAKMFPTIYKVNEGIPVTNANGLRTQTGTLRAADGTQGTFKNTFTLKVVKGGTVRCGGKTYHGPDTEDLKNPGGGTFSIAGWGTATFKTARTVAVFRIGGPSPPVCGTDTGTFRFYSGRLKGRQGTFTHFFFLLLTSSAKDTLVLH